MVKEFEGDAGAPLPDFTGGSNIQLQTIAPTLGIGRQQIQNQPDYLDYEQKRSVTTIMFANAGVAYLGGVLAGGVYGVKLGLDKAPSAKPRIKLNSVLNQTGYYGARRGNAMGVLAVLYSFWESTADYVDLEEKLGFRYVSSNSNLAAAVSPTFAAAMTGATYYLPSGPRVAGLAGVLGMSGVVLTYTGYYMMGIPFASNRILFF